MGDYDDDFWETIMSGHTNCLKTFGPRERMDDLLGEPWETLRPAAGWQMHEDEFYNLTQAYLDDAFANISIQIAQELYTTKDNK